MQIEMISINVLASHLNHATGSGVTQVKLNKKTMYPEAIKYVEEHCNKNGFEVLNFIGDGNAHYYCLVKK